MLGTKRQVIKFAGAMRCIGGLTLHKDAMKNLKKLKKCQATNIFHLFDPMTSLVKIQRGM